MKRFSLFILITTYSLSLLASTPRSESDTIKWFKDARFGMFVHFGVSSALGGVWEGKPVSGYSEWIMSTCKIPKERYFKEVVKPFDPAEFNAEEWILLAKNTGMKYFIVTAKHHDGVAMYDSKVSDYDIASSRFKRDILGELRDACKKYGLKFGFYYSHAMDWGDKDAPGNDWDFDNPGGARQLLGGREWHKQHDDFMPNLLNYFGTKVFPQIKELIDHYDPDIMWFDTPSRVPQELNALVFKYVRLINPKILVNSRIAFYPLEGVDFEDTQDRPFEFYPVEGLWEALPTTNNSYGYSQFDNSHKPSSFFIRLIAKAAAKGGNILLNMGPMGNGKPDPRDITIFNGIGKWFAVNRESIYGTDKTTLPNQNWGETTHKENKIYLHIFDWPKDGQLILGGLKNNISKAYLLSDKNKKCLSFKRMNSLDYLINVGKSVPDTVDAVVVLEHSELNCESDSRRLLLPGYINELRVFDCNSKSKDLEFGDGMKPNIYVKNITSTDQFITWTTRLNEDTKYEVTVEYQNSGKLTSRDFVVEAPTQLEDIKKTENAEQNRLQILLGNNSLEANLSATADTSYARTVLGIVALPKGNIDITLKAAKIATKEFARPKSIYLTKVRQ
ncbi:MAG: alpha-L-fucosidase [Paludibacter sp.]|nr:alpha-L-fucosidase [Paludibacter sp.]